ncbi:hypothetical protein TNCV_1679161 [Trichonephila clavipes]|nr:hypothetical protein TNCV_1679161 [Trichonephila clavipes]
MGKGGVISITPLACDRRRLFRSRICFRWTESALTEHGYPSNGLRRKPLLATISTAHVVFAKARCCGGSWRYEESRCTVLQTVRLMVKIGE